MNEVSDLHVRTMLCTDPAYDSSSKPIAIGDTVIVRPEEASRSRGPWCEWQGEVVEVHALQPVSGGKRVMVQPPKGSQWSAQPCMVRASLTRVIASDGEAS